jgi:hypothetical protein
LKDDVKRVFLTLLESHIHSIQNCGMPFLIPDGFFLPIDKKEQWQHIVEKTNLVTGIQILNFKINVRPHLIEPMLHELTNRHIFKCDKDIIENSELKVESNKPT